MVATKQEGHPVSCGRIHSDAEHDSDPTIEEKQLQPVAVTAQQQTTARKTGYLGRIAIVGAITLILVSGAGFILGNHPNATAPSSHMEIALTEKWAVLQPNPVSAVLDISAVVNPLRYIPLSAPFDGTVVETLHEAGDAIKAGEIILKLDDGDTVAKLREAQTQYLSAKMALQEIDQWETSAEVQRSKRQLDTARSELARLEREVTDLKDLYGRGIVSRNEYAGAILRRNQQDATVISAQENLASSLTRGNQDNRKLAELKLEIAEARFRDLQEQIKRAEVAAPIAGILMPLPKSTEEETAGFHVGARITRGTPLFVVADTTRFILTGTIDELDISQVHAGQKVRIDSEVFAANEPLSGEVAAISARAANVRTPGAPPTFEVRVILDPVSEAIHGAIRIGMSARMQVETYRNSRAFLLPPSAILRKKDGTSIIVDQDGTRMDIPVTLGRPFPNGIEIVSGAEAGMKVLLNPVPEDLK